MEDFNNKKIKIIEKYIIIYLFAKLLPRIRIED
jgi:hypothetical protein